MNSLAVYYLKDPDMRTVHSRKKALFAPAPLQEAYPEVIELIIKRSEVYSAAQVYET